MAINERLRRLLEQSRVDYDLFSHPEAFRAQDVAWSVHVPERKLAKVVVVRAATGPDLMVVLPASQHFDHGVLHWVTGRSTFQLEDEKELQRLFPDCELGAMPPFGHLYGLPMYVDPCLAQNEEIFFQAGNHHEVVSMRYQDYETLARPFFCEVCLHQEVAAASG